MPTEFNQKDDKRPEKFAAISFVAYHIFVFAFLFALFVYTFSDGPHGVGDSVYKNSITAMIIASCFITIVRCVTNFSLISAYLAGRRETVNNIAIYILSYIVIFVAGIFVVYFGYIDFTRDINSAYYYSNSRDIIKYFVAVNGVVFFLAIGAVDIISYVKSRCAAYS